MTAVDAMRGCCYGAIDEAVSACLEDFSDGMADPELEAYLSISVVEAVRTHDCERGESSCT